MPSQIFKKDGSVVEVDLLTLFKAQEGEFNQYYGKIRQGKTYAATADALHDLNRGKIVYTSWIIKWPGKDERKDFFLRLLGVLGLKKNFVVFKKNNWRHLPLDDQFHLKFPTLTDCKVYLDEGHIVYDSYQTIKMKLTERIAILATGHYDRCVNIISQRPTAIHVSLRANVNRFYKCEKAFDFFGIRLFKRSEYQDMIGETVNDTGEPDSVKYYFGRKKIYQAYDTKYMRGNVKRSQDLIGEIHEWDWKISLKNLFKNKYE